MICVLDASITLAWLYPDEITPTIKDLFEELVKSSGWVPALWPIEVANGLSWSIKRKRIDVAFRRKALEDLSKLPLFTDSETEIHAWGSTLLLADKYNLTVYDATYLELAIRRKLPLATLDRELRIAAELEGVELLGL